MTTTLCSANYCQKTGTRFDGSTWMIACNEHENKWRKQMIDLGVVPLTTFGASEKGEVCVIPGCNTSGYYRLDGTKYCYKHVEIGAVSGYVNCFNDVCKMVYNECENGHQIVQLDNEERPCYCGKKLKS